MLERKLSKYNPLWLRIFPEAPCMGTCMTHDTCSCGKQFDKLKEAFGMSKYTDEELQAKVARPMVANYPQQLYVLELSEGFAPTRATVGSAGYDCAVAETFVATKESDGTPIPMLVGLGFCVAVPDGFVGLLVPRSSMFKKCGLKLANTVGVIDSDYRGEVKALLTLEHGQFNIKVEAGIKLVQLVIVPAFQQPVQLLSASEFNQLATTRGVGGFGSTDFASKE